MQGTVGSTMTPGASTARDTASQMTDKAHSGIDRLSATAHNTVDRVKTAAVSAADRFADGPVMHTAQEWKDTTCAYVRDHPMTAVGIAVAAGFLLSRLTSFR